MEDCVFCPIASGDVDDDLVAYRSAGVFVIPALRQRARNRPHTLVLPVAHVRNLHDADAGVLAEIGSVTARLTAAFPRVYQAVGSITFQNNVEPDGLPFHLHMHVVPRFDDDGFATPDPAGVAEVPRTERLAQSAELRQMLGSSASGVATLTAAAPPFTSAPTAPDAAASALSGPPIVPLLSGLPELVQSWVRVCWGYDTTRCTPISHLIKFCARLASV
jgi:histidine triad (HIT) family protein